MALEAYEKAVSEGRATMTFSTTRNDTVTVPLEGITEITSRPVENP